MPHLTGCFGVLWPQPAHSRPWGVFLEKKDDVRAGLSQWPVWPVPYSLS